MVRKAFSFSKKLSTLELSSISSVIIISKEHYLFSAITICKVFEQIIVLAKYGMNLRQGQQVLNGVIYENCINE